MQFYLQEGALLPLVLSPYVPLVEVMVHIISTRHYINHRNYFIYLASPKFQMHIHSNGNTRAY